MSADSMGERGEPCRVPVSGWIMSEVKLLKVMDSVHCSMKLHTHVHVWEQIPRCVSMHSVSFGLR